MPITDFYNIRETGLTTEFLATQPEIAKLLTEAPAHIKAIWGENTHVNLEVLIEPEEGPPWETLMVYIETADDVDTALAKLGVFSNGWWCEQSAAVRRQVVFDVEFVGS